MTPGRERMAQLRWRRQIQGERQVTVWLDQDSVDRLVALRRPGEHDSQVVRRALRALEAQEASGRQGVPSGVTGDTPHRDHDAQATAALVGLLTLLFPPGRPIYPRTRYGWQMFPLAEINRLLAPEGWVIRATKTRTPARAILCTDAYGGVERYGLFELRRVGEEA
jgi:hypothetical protein